MPAKRETKRKNIQARVTQGLFDRVVAYQKANGLKKRSTAIVRLVELGLEAARDGWELVETEAEEEEEEEADLADAFSCELA
jgi:hypothetical protein